MAALGATITAEDLSLAGITGALATAITGLTWVEAKAKLGAILGLAAGNEGLKRGAVTSYSVNGRTIATSMDQIQKAMDAVSRGAQFAAGSGGGLRALPIEWGA